ncbi:prepilin-type N-terminal cleavage/methylation domain-containing protein [Burkholderiales bacterium JOSHI_001]|nr:prepilin-type N-terminal cleavage/methylation domain-containing protein [Burkholderiales bacterium JOSHI_001]
MVKPMRTPGPRGRRRGFTLIELSVVLAVIALLLLLVTPRYFGALDRSKDKVLAHNLLQVRAAIDQYHADRGRYPESLDELVRERYLRSMPVNPVTEAVDWVLLPPPPGELGTVFDVQAPESSASAAAHAADGHEAPR